MTNISLTALPVTQAEILTLQQKVSVRQNASEATSRAADINAGTNTVKGYACELLTNNTPLAQVAMCVRSIMISTPPIAEFENIVKNFLPNQVAWAVAYGYNPTVYAAEAYGLALSSNGVFQSNYSVPATTWTDPEKNTFSNLVSAKTGVNANSILGYLNNWITFYTNNPSATQGLSVSVAAAGASVGDAVGVALLNPTAANLQHNCTGHINGLVSNALVNNALGTYTSGITLGAMAAHGLLQGES